MNEQMEEKITRRLRYWFGDLKNGNHKYFPHEKYSDDPDFEKWYRKLKGK